MRKRRLRKHFIAPLPRSNSINNSQSALTWFRNLSVTHREYKLFSLFVIIYNNLYLQKTSFVYNLFLNSYKKIKESAVTSVKFLGLTFFFNTLSLHFLKNNSFIDLKIDFFRVFVIVFTTKSKKIKFLLTCQNLRQFFIGIFSNWRLNKKSKILNKHTFLKNLLRERSIKKKFIFEFTVH